MNSTTTRKRKSAPAPATYGGAKVNRSLQRSFTLIEWLADRRRARLGEIATGSGLSPATALRFLGTLVGLGYVRADEGGYALTTKLRALAHRITAADASRAVSGHLEGVAAATGLTAFLVVEDDDEALYLHRATPERSSMISAQRIGRRAPLYCTAVGKVLLAARDPAGLAAYLSGHELRRLTPTTRASAPALRRDLAEIAGRGWALDDEECEAGLRCVAVPVFGPDGRPFAALSASGQADRIDPARTAALVRRLTAAAAAIAREVGPEDLR